MKPTTKNWLHTFLLALLFNLFIGIMNDKLVQHFIGTDPIVVHSLLAFALFIGVIIIAAFVDHYTGCKEPVPPSRQNGEE